jgi:hypothetical protein
VKSLKSFVRPLAFAAAAAVAFGACDEQFNGGGACPALCPSPQAQLRDTTFFAIAMDTTITGYPALGSEQVLFVAAMGDTLETAAVIRFDSLPNTFRRLNSATDSVIMAVDSAYLRLTIQTGDTLGLATTVDVYDVDMDGAEEADPSAVTSMFTAARLLGSRTIPADSLRDSLLVPLDNAKILAKSQLADSSRRRLRLGIKLRDGGANTLRIAPSNIGAANFVIFRPSQDTTVPKLFVSARSTTPDEPVMRAELTDYLVIMKGTPEPPAGTFRVGGLPARRAYLRFDIPSSILDSSSVVRATLQMTQRPALFSPDARDTVSILHYGVVASPAITDLSRALLFIDRLATNADSLRVAPADSGLREFEIIGWVRVWKGTQTTKTPRALSLAFPIPEEGNSGSVVDFFSLEATTAAVRPRLRLTYLPRTTEVVP